MKDDADSTKEAPRPADRRWVDGFPGTITVIDAQGTIIDMNESAAQAFADRGGRGLVGASAFNCHPGPCREKLETLMESREKRIYTVLQGGRHKFVILAPWFVDGEYAGYLDMSLEIPETLPHFDRDRK
jgi:hypothetical protein